MKLKLLWVALLGNLLFMSAQDAPVIEGDVLLCPWTNGTATVTNGQTYDTYQWYYKYWFLSDDFEAIPDATSETFTYDWYTYDQALFKLVVTINGETYESNTIQIDSYAWVSLSVMQEASENVTFDPNSESYLICDGDTITNTLTSPYNVAQWYKDGEAIPGATEMTYVITEPGTYYVIAAPDFCPNSTSTSLSINVSENPDCSLSTNNPEFEHIALANNPVKNLLTLQNMNNVSVKGVSIYNMAGQKIGDYELENNTSVNVSSLPAGVYFLKLMLTEKTIQLKFVKQ